MKNHPDRPREVVVVTGASAGIGRAIAREFGRQGARIGLVARNRAALEHAAAEIAALGGEAIVCVADVADPSQVAAAAQAVEDAFGPIDIWVNNAMVTIVSPIADLEPDEIQRVTDVTYLGTVHGTIVALQRMRPRNRGTIVQVGSALAYRSIPLQAPYCGAKAAVRAFTDSLRSELCREGSGIRVTVVHLPAHDTPQFDWCRTKMPRLPRPVPPVFDPEVAARSIAWAAHHPRREFVVGGSTLLALVGQKLVPGLLDRYLARSAWDAQQREELTGTVHADNLFQPLPGDFGAHGSFGEMAKSTSLFTWLNRNRAPLAGLALATMALLLVAGLGRAGTRARPRWH